MIRANGLWTVLSIDPSINDAGYSGWNGGVPTQWGLVHPPRALKSWRQKANSVRLQFESLVRQHDPLFVICESPETIYEGRSSPRSEMDGVIKLCYLVGGLSATIHAQPSLPRFFLEVTPNRWKGHCTKQATRAVINARYGLNIGETKTDFDISDAIGVGDWFHRMCNERFIGDGFHVVSGVAKAALLPRALVSAWRTPGISIASLEQKTST